MKVLFIARGPSPYRVAFFNELGKLCNLTVLFELHPNEINDRDKSWGKEDYRYFEAKYLKKTLKIKNDNLCVEVLKYLNKKIYDVIIVGMYSTPTQMLAITYLKARGIKYILSSDGGFVKKDTALQRALKSFFISGAQMYFASSRGTEKYLRYYGAKTKVVIYPFTTKMAKELPNDITSDDEKAKLRKELGIPMGKKIVLCVGQFIHRKGIDILIQSAAKLDESYYFLCIGGKVTPEYRKLCDKYGVYNIEFVEFMQQNILSDYYKASDIFVLPTREDIWGLVINEAMSYGLPVITTDNCLAGTELVVDGENGYIVPVDNVEETAYAINKVFSAEKRRYMMQENNYKKMKVNYTIEKMALAHYEALCTMRNNV